MSTVFPSTCGSTAIGGTWHPLTNGRSNWTMSMKDEPPAGPGHNSKISMGDWHTPSKLSFEDAAAANAGPGRNLHRLRVLQVAIFDPRLGICPLPVKLLSAVMDHANRETGTAYPGAKALAEEIHQDLQKLPPEERAAALDKAANVIMNMFTLLKQCGYDVSTRRGPPGGGRAVAHHALTYPEHEEMLAAIPIHERWQEQENARRAEAKKKATSPHAAHEVSSPHVTHEVTDFTRHMRSDGADLTCTGFLTSRVPAQNGPPLSITEPIRFNLGANAQSAGATSPEANPKVEARSKPKRATPPARSAVAAAAVAAYNEAAERHGFARCEVLTEARAGRLDRRLVDIGGIEAFRLALTAIPRDKFLIGRVPGRNGGDPFKLTIDRLLQTDGGLGDVLAKLLDAASSNPSRATTDEQAEYLAAFERVRKEQGLA